MATSLKVDVSIMPDFPTPPPHSDASSTASSASPSSSSSTSSKERSTVTTETTPPPSCPFGPDYDQNGHKIKRPMNAFMVWAQMRRAEITAVSSKVHNSTISKALGVEWREMSEAAKLPFVQKAKELRDELFREHPHYVYRPRKRKSARPAPYSPHHAPDANSTPAALPAGSVCGGSLLLPSSSTSVSTPPPLASLLLHQPATAAAEQPAASQLPLLLAPGLLQQLQLAAVLQQQQLQQQQQQPSPQLPQQDAGPTAATAAMLNPLLLANLLNPLLAQMMSQFAPLSQ